MKKLIFGQVFIFLVTQHYALVKSIKQKRFSFNVFLLIIIDVKKIVRKKKGFILYFMDTYIANYTITNN